MTNPTDLTTALLRSFREPAPAPRGGDPGAAHPAGHPDLATTLRHRAAWRTYGTEAVDLATLVASVRAGTDLDARSWAGEQHCCPLEPVVFVLRSGGGLAPGGYRFGPAGPEPVADLPDPAGYPELVLQREFAEAGALVTILSDVDGAATRHGGHGYRTLMTRAGAAGYAVWLAAIAHGLVGTVFAGFLPDAVRGPLRLDGATRHQLFAVALGRPPVVVAATGADSPAVGPGDRTEETGKGVTADG